MSAGEAVESPDPRAAWTEAEALAAAAVALLDDPSVPEWTAAALLRRGHAALAIAIGREDADGVRRLALLSHALPIEI